MEYWYSYPILIGIIAFLSFVIWQQQKRLNEKFIQKSDEFQDEFLWCDIHNEEMKESKFTQHWYCQKCLDAIEQEEYEENILSKEKEFDKESYYQKQYMLN